MKALIQGNSVQKETDKAFLIKVPKKEIGFWFPKRFCKFKGKNDYQMEIWFGDNFTAKPIKLNTKTKIELEEISLSELLEGYLI